MKKARLSFDAAGPFVEVIVYVLTRKVSAVRGCARESMTNGVRNAAMIAQTYSMNMNSANMTTAAENAHR